jgi:predicted RNase H-related nuclease YkuK (DUF458 family)
MLEDKIIRDFHQREYIYDEMIQKIREFDKAGFSFYVGTDSQIIKRKISIVTCICCHKEGAGESKIFYIKERLKKKDYPSLRMRMLLEAYRSIEAAMEIEPHITNRLSVHLDVGSTKRSKTAKFHKELEFLVQAQGYLCAIKPDSWAASAVADRMAKS